MVKVEPWNTTGETWDEEDGLRNEARNVTIPSKRAMKPQQAAKS